MDVNFIPQLSGRLSHTENLQRVDVGGIYKITTNNVILDADNAQAIYGINPCEYRALPCESIVLLTIHASVPATGAAYEVMLAVPNNGSTTAQNATSTTAATRLPIVDSKNTAVTGANVVGVSQRFVYINKHTGTVRFLEFTNA